MGQVTRCPDCGYHSPSPSDLRQHRANEHGRVCSVEDCDTPLLARGLCPMHWRRWRLYGDPLRRHETFVDEAARFWSKVDKTEDCWLWTGTRQTFGYGRFWVYEHQDKIGAHRWSWEYHFGSIPEGSCVLHRCDEPACVRPDHLFLGTKADNTQDMIAKGRANRPLPPAHCRHGHEFTPENTYKNQGRRHCRECRKLWARRRRARDQMR